MKTDRKCSYTFIQQNVVSIYYIYSVTSVHNRCSFIIVPQYCPLSYFYHSGPILLCFFVIYNAEVGGFISGHVARSREPVAFGLIWRNRQNKESIVKPIFTVFQLWEPETTVFHLKITIIKSHCQSYAVKQLSMDRVINIIRRNKNI